MGSNEVWPIMVLSSPHIQWTREKMFKIKSVQRFHFFFYKRPSKHRSKTRHLKYFSVILTSIRSYCSLKPDAMFCSRCEMLLQIMLANSLANFTAMLANFSATGTQFQREKAVNFSLSSSSNVLFYQLSGVRVNSGALIS